MNTEFNFETMQIHFIFRKVDSKAKEKLKKYLTAAKISRLTRLLRHGNLELVDFGISVEYFSKHNAFAAKLKLKIVKHSLIGEETSHDIIKAFDLALSRLISQLRKAR